MNEAPPGVGTSDTDARRSWRPEAITIVATPAASATPSTRTTTRPGAGQLGDGNKARLTPTPVVLPRP